MKTQSDPVTEDEFVLRRIPVRTQYVDEALPQPVQRLAFAPDSERDKKGLSVFRALFTTATDLSARGKSPAGYLVVSLAVRDLIELGMSVVADPQEDQLPGHALIPDLGYDAKVSDPTRSKELQDRLAELASKRIILRPRQSGVA